MSASIDTDATYEIGQAESPSEAVVTAVAEAEGVDPTDLRPLYEVVDPDALDRLFRQRVGSRRAPRGLVEFSYHGYRVHVEGGWVSLVSTPTR